MTHFEYGDVVLVRMPYTDQRGSKQRPAVVVSGAAYGRARPDVVLMAVTSRISSPRGYGEIGIEDWRAAGLLKPSANKPVIFTVEQRLVVRVLGRLTERDRVALRKGLRSVIG